jgi:hypothetical protein
MRLDISAIEAFLGTRKLPALIRLDKPLDSIDTRKIKSDEIAFSFTKFFATVRRVLPLPTLKQIAL